MVAGETDLRDLNPYKPSDSLPNQSFIKHFTDAGQKVESVDILWDPAKSTVFWSDYHNKTIRRSYLYETPSTGSKSRHRRMERDDMVVIVVSKLLLLSNGRLLDFGPSDFWLANITCPNFLMVADG